jgi:hypothetical protein
MARIIHQGVARQARETHVLISLALATIFLAGGAFFQTGVKVFSSPAVKAGSAAVAFIAAVKALNTCVFRWVIEALV